MVPGLDLAMDTVTTMFRPIGDVFGDGYGYGTESNDEGYGNGCGPEFLFMDKLDSEGYGYGYLNGHGNNYGYSDYLTGTIYQAPGEYMTGDIIYGQNYIFPGEGTVENLLPLNRRKRG